MTGHDLGLESRRHPVTEERFATVSPGVDVCYQTIGDPSGEPLVLVMGLGGPMIWWPMELCDRLADLGFFVIRFDNRDAGRSSRLEGRVTLAQLAAAYAGVPVRPPYTLSDLAGDVVGLLDHLGVEAAHVAGMSMGGMVAQTVAVEHPDRVLSLTSIMSSTGRRTVGWQHPALLPVFLSKGGGKEAYVESGLRLWRIIGSPDYPVDEDVLRRQEEITYDRGVSASGTARQTLAIITQPDRGPALRSVTVPTLVIHGLADKMVHPSGGRETSLAVRGSELVLVPGMGHDLPRPLLPSFAAALRRTANRARR